MPTDTLTVDPIERHFEQNTYPRPCLTKEQVYALLDAQKDGTKLAERAIITGRPDSIPSKIEYGYVESPFSKYGEKLRLMRFAYADPHPPTDRTDLGPLLRLMFTEYKMASDRVWNSHPAFRKEKQYQDLEDLQTLASRQGLNRFAGTDLYLLSLGLSTV